MQPANYEEFRKILLNMRARLVGDVNHMTDLALNRSASELSSVPFHMADAGSDNYDQDFTLRLVMNGQETLTQIDDALERIEDGTYGICECCGNKIPKRRLLVVPYARMCVKCAEKNGQ
ncbi:MAG: TraR/DksA C4-type zinc finger protein [Thermoguttaceae bacterium]|nr:TraR/DksA C4-type zinc finger protein [Thermoguttaceae bacterium]